MVEWTVGDFAAITGVPVTTLHYYDRLALVPARRLGNGHRRYDAGSRQTLEFVQLCRLLGCSLDEIGLLLRSDGGGARRDLADAKLVDVDARMARLRQVRSVLEHLAVCTHGPDETDECVATIRRNLASLASSSSLSSHS
jgi:MerR family redox-sensitive transcriptional activator SoxR